MPLLAVMFAWLMAVEPRLCPLPTADPGCLRMVLDALSRPPVQSRARGAYSSWRPNFGGLDSVRAVRWASRDSMQAVLIMGFSREKPIIALAGDPRRHQFSFLRMSSADNRRGTTWTTIGADTVVSRIYFEDADDLLLLGAFVVDVDSDARVDWVGARLSDTLMAMAPATKSGPGSRVDLYNLRRGSLVASLSATALPALPLTLGVRIGPGEWVSYLLRPDLGVGSVAVGAAPGEVTQLVLSADRDQTPDVVMRRDADGSPKFGRPAFHTSLRTLDVQGLASALRQVSGELKRRWQQEWSPSVSAGLGRSLPRIPDELKDN